jgi:hypothetical protein
MKLAPSCVSRIGLVCVWVDPGKSRACEPRAAAASLPVGVEPNTSSCRTAAVAVDECHSNVPSSGRHPCNSRHGSDVVVS